MHLKNQNNEVKLLRIKQVAARWGCSPETVERRIRDGSLSKIKIGPRIVAVTIESIMGFEEAGKC